MRSPSVTISSPCHPAMAEMVSALERDVEYEFVGPRVRDGSGTSAGIGSIARVAYAAAVRLRRSAWGAVAYHRARSFVLLRSVPKGALVHCCSHLSYRGVPWIGDYENVNVLAFYSPRLLRDQHFLSHLIRKFRHPSCRVIRVWSASAERSFRALFQDEDIRGKVRVIHPTIALPPEAGMPRRRGSLPRILFVARGFWVKGGSLFLEAVSQLRRELEFRVDFVCDLPAECEHYRAALNGTVNFYEPVFTRPELYARFYNTADVFVMLGMADSYGLALLEASAFGLPILAMQLNSGLSDFLRLAGNAVQVEPPQQIFDSDGLHCLEPEELVQRIRSNTQPRAVERITDALRLLVSDRDKREQLGERGRAALLNGPFSVATMREAMLGLYQSAMD
jgi:glycosyltransferase involved in cell wall biosynthesis